MKSLEPSRGHRPHEPGHGLLGPPEPHYEPMHLRDYWGIVRSHPMLVFGFTLLVTLLVGYWTAGWSDYYEGSARLEIKPEQPNPVIAAGGKLPLMVDRDPAYLNTQLQILTSPSLLGFVVKSLDLPNDKIFLRHMVKGGRILRKLLRLVSLGPSYMDDASLTAAVPLTQSLDPEATGSQLREAQRLEPYVHELQERLTVEQVKETHGITKETRLVNLTFRHPHPLISAKIVNAIADAMVLTTRRGREGAGDVTSEYLRRRIEELRNEIHRGEERLIQYARNHDIISLEAGQNTAVDRLVSLNRELLEAENERKLAAANYQVAQSPQAAISLAREESNKLKDSESQLADLERQRALLLVGATEKWPRVQEVNQQIEVLKKQIAELGEQEVQTLLNNLKTRLRQAQEREDAIRDSFEKQRLETQNQNEAAVTYRLIKQEIDTSNSLLSDLRMRLREHDLARAGTESNIRVVDYALIPDPKKPDGPWRLVFVGLGFILSLGVGFGLAFFAEYMDNTLRSPEEVRQVLQLPALAMIPAAGRLAKGHFWGSLNALRSSTDRPRLLSQSAAPKLLEEDYRRLRTAVLLADPQHQPRKILVTSSVVGEGKTTTAINMAYSLRQTGAKVLIIDADLRRPRIHTVFGCDNDQGLSDILSEETLTGQEALLRYIRKDERTGVYFVCAGRSVPNPTELLGSQRMKDFTAWATSGFEFVLIDSPAVLGCADPILLSTLADAVLLVVKAGDSSRNLVQRSQQLLEDAGAPILGVVLNNTDSHGNWPPYRYYRDYTYPDDGPDDGNGSGRRAHLRIMIRMGTFRDS
jgi:capsular exopolysaccharide synthesis family protein